MNERERRRRRRRGGGGGCYRGIREQTEDDREIANGNDGGKGRTLVLSVRIRLIITDPSAFPDGI